MVNKVSEKYSKEQLTDRAFYRIAWNIYHMWSETGRSDTRLLMEPLIPEKFVLVGKSKQGSDHKEHVVPRVVLCDESHKMYQRGATIEDVAELLKKHLKVVLIAKEEQKHLDHVLGLKQCMPDGWSITTGSPFARLDVANIEYEIFA